MTPSTSVIFSIEIDSCDLIWFSFDILYFINIFLQQNVIKLITLLTWDCYDLCLQSKRVLQKWRWNWMNLKKMAILIILYSFSKYTFFLNLIFCTRWYNLYHVCWYHTDTLHCTCFLFIPRYICTTDYIFIWEK